MKRQFFQASMISSMTMIIIVLLFITKDEASGIIYYVDNTIADTHVASSIPDCNNYDPVTFSCAKGSAAAFATIADINVVSFQPDDQILFRQGQIWSGQLKPFSSGTSGHPITFGSFGAGANPEINGANLITEWSSGQANIWQASGVSYSPRQVFVNSVRGAVQSSEAACVTNGDWYYDPSSQILYLYSTTDPNLDTIEAAGSAHGIFISSKSYLVFNNLSVTKAGMYGVEVGTGKHISLSGVNVSLSGTSGIDIDQGSSVVTVTGGEITENGFIDPEDNNGIGTGGLGNASTGIVIDGVHIYNNLHSEIEAYGPPSGPSDVLIKNCLIEGGNYAIGDGIKVDGPGVGTVTIHHNVIRNNYGSGVIAEGAAVPVLQVYQNTITGNRGNGIYALNGNWVIENNIIQNNDSASLGWAEIDTEATTGTFNSDYNVIWRASGSTYFIWQSRSETWAEWKTLSGGDSHSFNADAKLNANDTLQSTSPAIGTGEVLSSNYQLGLSPASSWPSNVITLSQNSTATGWDMGVYVFVPILYGDVNADGQVTIYDAFMASQFALGLTNLTADQQKAADVSGDGKVTTYDAFLIAQYAVGLIKKFPVG